jgi:methylated-DNA-[protein]-cysteine S-methyltransferase
MKKLVNDSKANSPKAIDTLYWDTWNSPFGTVTVSCSGKGIRELAFASGKIHSNGSSSCGPARREAVELIRAGRNQSPGAQFARQAIAELREYASGRLQRFSLPLDLGGTPFQRKVWKALRAIPYGETRSYQQVARAVGNPRASRAVGMANHWNPVAIVVPCHRVIAADGTLGGYAGGLERKTQMLQFENSHSHPEHRNGKQIGRK